MLCACVMSSVSTLFAAGDEVKTGWNFGPLPAVGYSTDLGFQYGALCEMFYYGDGSTFPAPKHRIYVEASTMTKGSSILDFVYDSKYLIPNIRTTLTVSYLPDNMYSFYGFNGYMTPYNAELGAGFYSVNREYFRSYLDFQGSLGGDFSWAAGFGFYKYELSPVKVESYVGKPSLFNEYLSSGLISTQECAGKHLEFRAGLVHDTRDAEADPTRGFFTEAIAIYSPDLFEGEDADFAQLAITHRGYIPVVGDKLTFAYRLALQSAIYGDVPMYHQQNIATLLLRRTYSEGLGGVNSLRGVLRNRAVGQGYALSNLELRYRFCNFKFIGQNWHLGLTPFVDMGQVINPFRAEEMRATENPLIYAGGEESIHSAAGLGFEIAMNRNFIINVEYGKALSKQDGTSSFAIALNYLF